MRPILTVLALAALVPALPTIPAQAADGRTAGEVLLETIFDATEKAIIEEYFGKQREREHEHHKGHKTSKGKNKQMPPGLAKRNTLPPGLERHLERNGTLPPGLEGRALPDDLEARLPRAKKGTKRVIVDGDIVLIREGTRQILDVIRDVIGGE